MAKKIRFALKMKDGVEARNLQELQEHFDIDSVMEYYLNGKLETWLDDRYYDEEANQVRELAPESSELSKKLCEIFQVEYVRDALTPEEAEVSNRKIERLREITDDEEIIDKVDSVAFSQEELADLLDEGLDTIYLCGKDFQIPLGKRDMTYIGIQTILTLTDRQLGQYMENGIRFVNLLRSEEIKGQNVFERQEENGPLICLCESVDTGKWDLLVYEDDRCQEYQERKWKSTSEKDLHIEFQKKFVEIPVENMIEARKVSCVGNRILYIGKNGQGTFLGTMNLDGTQDRVIRYLPDKWGRRYRFCRDYILVVNREFGDVERDINIDLNGIQTEIDANFDEFPCGVCEASNGLYSITGTVFRDEISNETKRGFVVKELNSGEKIIKRYQFEKDAGVEYGLGDGGELKAVYSNRSLDKVYFLWGSRFGTDAQIWFFDTNTKEIARATSIKIGNFKKLFGVKGNEIFYHGSDDKYPEIMSLNMETGRKRCLWENLASELGGVLEKLLGMLKGEYIYLRGGTYMEDRVYKVKIDGSERTVIGKSKFDTISGDLKTVKETPRIREIKEWC